MVVTALPLSINSRKSSYLQNSLIFFVLVFSAGSFTFDLIRLPLQFISRTATIFSVTLKIAIWVIKMSSIIGKKVLVRYPRAWAACSALLWSVEKTLMVANWTVTLFQTCLTILDFALAALSAIGTVFQCIWNTLWSFLTLGVQFLAGLVSVAQEVQATAFSLWKKFPTWAKAIIIVAIVWSVFVQLELFYWRIWFLVRKPYFIKASSALSYILNIWLELLWNTLYGSITYYKSFVEFNVYTIPCYCLESLKTTIYSSLVRPIVATHQTIVKWLCVRVYWLTQMVQDVF